MHHTHSFQSIYDVPSSTPSIYFFLIMYLFTSANPLTFPFFLFPKFQIWLNNFFMFLLYISIYHIPTFFFFFKNKCTTFFLNSASVNLTSLCFVINTVPSTITHTHARTTFPLKGNLLCCVV